MNTGYDVPPVLTSQPFLINYVKNLMRAAVALRDRTVSRGFWGTAIGQLSSDLQAASTE